MQAKFIATLLIGFTAILASCNEPKNLEFRELKNTKLSNIGFSAATLTADVVLYNPNNFGLELSRTDLDIFVENNLFGHTSQNVQVSIPRKEVFTLPLSMDIDTKNLLKNGFTAYSNKEVTIRALGSVKVGKMGVYKSFPVDYSTKQVFKLF